jgi:hypothetical protein
MLIGRQPKPVRIKVKKSAQPGGSKGRGRQS